MFRVIYAFNVAKWKRQLVKKYFKGNFVVFLALNTSSEKLDKIVKFSPRCEFLVWGMNEPRYLKYFAESNRINITRIEDGFIRSIGLGVDQQLPYSLCIDRKGIYFNSSTVSDLEEILNNHNFASDNELMRRAAKLLEYIRTNGFSKYIIGSNKSCESIYGPKRKRRILVLGQVEDDQSIVYGCKRVLSNKDLIDVAVNENPGAQIIYKPHPDYFSGCRQTIIPIDDIKADFLCLEFSVSLKSALASIDHVYCITSLAGFEALIHGVSVTTLGAPFYSGWGLTDDRTVIDRRVRKLSIEEVFAASYLLYPKYKDPKTGKSLNLESVLEIFLEEMDDGSFSKELSFFESLYYYNLATQKEMNPLYFLKKTFNHVAIITDNYTSMDIAYKLHENDVKSDVLTILDRQFRDYNFAVDIEMSDFIRVSSIQKTFGIPFSDVEKSSVYLANQVAKCFKGALNKLDGIVDDRSVNAFRLDFEDFIFHEAVRFFSASKIVEKYDSVFVFTTESSNDDVKNSLKYHAKLSSNVGKLNFVESERMSVSEVINRKSSGFDNKLAIESTVDLLQKVKSILWDVKSSIGLNVSNADVLVVGNLFDNNYAYSPAAHDTLSAIPKDKKVTLVHPAITSEAVLNNVRNHLFTEGRYSNVSQVKITMAEVREMFPDRELLALFNEYFLDLIKVEVLTVYSNEILEVFWDRIQSYVNDFINKLIYSFKIEAICRPSNIAYTTLERSFSSNLIYGFTREQAKRLIGIQPQIISTSPRYRKPLVDVMGVIDSQQQFIFEQLGFSGEICKIGSANIYDRLVRLKNGLRKYDLNEVSEKRKVLFVMQHSTENEMLAIAKAFAELVTDEYELMVKPHPHQEFGVLNKVKVILGENVGVNFCGAESDTYELINQCDVVVGLFSSVLYESILVGRKVIVADFFGLNDSVNFASLGLALKAQNKQQLKNTIESCMNDDSSYSPIDLNVTKYLEKNSHLNEYSMKSVFNRFIKSYLV
jgi:hypothetical protein